MRSRRWGQIGSTRNVLLHLSIKGEVYPGKSLGTYQLCLRIYFEDGLERVASQPHVSRVGEAAKSRSRYARLSGAVVLGSILSNLANPEHP